MKFSYTRYEIDPTPTVPRGVLYRPEIKIAISGPRRFATVRALVDTGSDETVFPASLAGKLEIDLNEGAVGRASAVGGHEVQLTPGSATLLLSQGAEQYRWQSMVAFLQTHKPEEEVILLGFAGFLEFFEATFDSENYTVTLTPNSRLRSV